MKDTKTKLLNNAAKMFAKYGPDGISTRDLAKQAKVNLCSINYYFGTKQKLYEAVLADVVDFLLKNFVNPMREAAAKNSLTPCEEIKFLIGSFFEFMCTDKVSEAQIQLLLREVLNPSPAYDHFYSVVFGPIHFHVSELIAGELGIEPDSTQAVLLTHTLFGQAVMFRIHRAALLRRMNIKKYTPELISQARDMVLQNCQAILDQARMK